MTQLQSVTCHMGSQSVTCHPTQVNTPRLNPSQTGQYAIYLPRRDRRLSGPRWLVTYRTEMVHFGPILHRFWDTATYLLKIAYFSYPCYLASPIPMFPLEFRGKVRRRATRVIALRCGESCMILTSTVSDWSTRVTYGQTDGPTDGR